MREFIEERLMGIGQLLFTIGILGLLFFIGLYLIQGGKGVTRSQLKYVKNTLNYEEVKCVINQKLNQIYLICDDDNYQQGGFKLWGENEAIIDESGFWWENHHGDEITIKTLPKKFDGGYHPIVELKKGDKTYLDFETGHANQVKTFRTMRWEHLKWMAPTLVITLVLLGSSIGMIIYAKKSVFY